MKLAAAALALVLCAAVPAGAATDRPCVGIADDQRGLVEGTTGEPWRDLLSAAVGSDTRRVTVLLRLRELPASPARPEHALVDYTMRFEVAGRTAFLTAPADERAAPSYGVEIGHRPVVLGQAPVAQDRERRELRITAPVSAFAPHADLRPGGTASRLAALVAVSPAVAGTPAAVRAQTVIVDTVDGNKATARLGSASCVPVGR